MSAAEQSERWMGGGEWQDDALVVCIAHGRFVPCRTNGEHRQTDNPFWVKSVRDYQTSTIANLTWEPAWEGEGSAD